MSKQLLDPMCSTYYLPIYVLRFLGCIVLHFGAAMIHFPHQDRDCILLNLMYYSALVRTSISIVPYSHTFLLIHYKSDNMKALVVRNCFCDAFYIWYIAQLSCACMSGTVVVLEDDNLLCVALKM